jgi:Domain of unknown function (DUF4157)
MSAPGRTFEPTEWRSPRRVPFGLAMRNTAASTPARGHPLLRLQRTMGNQAVQRLLQRREGLAVSAPGDVYEQEAERVAGAVMSMPDRSEEEEEEADLQAPAGVRRRLLGAQGGGNPLPAEVRAFMEPRFGADFSGVRVHVDTDAGEMNRELHAQAFTHQQDIYYGPGRSPGNDALTAHELTHVLQQSGGVDR